MKDHKENEIMESGWAGPGIEIWPEEDDYVMWRSMKERGLKMGRIFILANKPVGKLVCPGLFPPLAKQHRLTAQES